MDVCAGYQAHSYTLIDHSKNVIIKKSHLLTLMNQNWKWPINKVNFTNILANQMRENVDYKMIKSIDSDALVFNHFCTLF